ncbi:MAG: META domain-containing protein [Pseudomonadota bacterium]
MRPISVILTAALAVTACAAQAARDPVPAAPAASSIEPTQANLDGTEWHFVEIGGQPVPAGVNATLRLREGHASGRSGCNAYGARYHVAADGTATFTQTLSTKMACLQPAGAMHVEQGVFNAFRKAVKVEISNGELVMLDAAGKPLAKLAQTTSP